MPEILDCCFQLQPITQTLIIICLRRHSLDELENQEQFGHCGLGYGADTTFTERTYSLGRELI